MNLLTALKGNEQKSHLIASSFRLNGALNRRHSKKGSESWTRREYITFTSKEKAVSQAGHCQ